MNKVVLMGRLTRNPEVRYSQGDASTAVARYTLAVDRRFKRQGDEQTADFINCVSFGKIAEFVDKYLKQGTKIVGCGRIQTGSYVNREGQKVYTTDVVLEEIEFAESKNASSENTTYKSAPVPQVFPVPPTPQPSQAVSDGFMNIPDDFESDLPFN